MSVRYSKFVEKMTHASSLAVSCTLTNKLDDFNGIVSAGDYHALGQFIKDNPKEVEFFVSKNVNVLEVALRNQHLAIYALLTSQGFTMSADNDSEITENSQKSRKIMDAEIKSGNMGKSEFDENLVKSLGSAHERTSVKLSKIQSVIPGLSKGPLLAACEFMEREEMWFWVSLLNVEMVQNIIKFARVLPRLWNLSVYDQEHLLRRSVFEVWVIRMTRYIDLKRNIVFYGSSMLPRDLFSSSDEPETRFLSETFDLARSIAELKLSDDELALYQSVVVTWPEGNFEQSRDRYSAVTQSFNEILTAFKEELCSNRPNGYGSLLDILIGKIPSLRKLSATHLQLFTKFKEDYPSCGLPSLLLDVFTENQ